MKLFPKNIKVPALYSQEKLGDEAKVYVKLFDIFSQAKWYITEYDAEQKLAFGFVNLFGDVNDGCAELGYISIDEIEEMNAKFPRIERDMYFPVCTLADVKSGKVS
jgi:hypothetical protein